MRKMPFKRGVSINALSAYFEYLENRCLKSFSNQPYRNLLDIRLLFYVPLPSTLLSKMTFSNFIAVTVEAADVRNSKIYFIQHDNQRYRVPLTFVEFAKALLSEKDSLLSRDSKELNAFVEKSVRAAKIEEKITPKLIQNSLGSICRLEGYFPGWLPSR